MDQNGHIYAEFVGEIPAEDVARLDGYLRGREDEREGTMSDDEAGRLLRKWEALQKAKRKDAANGGRSTEG